jgi:response regulator of citrate/malate metabolism
MAPMTEPKVTGQKVTAPKVTAPIRVLVVDDDFMVGRLHRDFVNRLPGFEVVGEARTGSEALERIRELTPDIVLLDVYLPDISGIEVLERLRSQGPAGVDVLMITAARDTETVSRALQFGAVHYLIKPFGFADLAERLSQVAAARRHLTRHASEPLGQADVDKVFGSVRPAAESSRGLPKGLSEPTMDLVVAELREQADAESAAEFGDRVGLSRVSARRYLEHLVKVGWVEVALKYGATGRPERRYRWTRS